MTAAQLDGVIVRVEHCRRLGYCARGIRQLCVKHNLDYTSFVENGIPAADLLAAVGDDAMVLAVVEVACG